MSLRTSIPASLSAFVSWLVEHPVVGDQTYSGQSVRYQVARYCEYLHSNPWPSRIRSETRLPVTAP